MTNSLWERGSDFLRERFSYSRDQKRMLEERGDEFSKARDEYNRALWEITQVLNRYGRDKRYVFDALEKLPGTARTSLVRSAEEKVRFLLQENRPLERTGITGAALRDWGHRDLSYPDIVGLKPQDAFEIYDTITENLRGQANTLSAIVRPISRWCDCAEGLIKVLEMRKKDPEKAKPVAKLLALFLEAELFVKRDTEYVFQEEKFRAGTDAILEILEKTGVKPDSAAQ